MDHTSVAFKQVSTLTLNCLNIRYTRPILIISISTEENFPQKENFVKCDWPTQIFRRKKILKLKIFLLSNDIFGKFSVRGNFS
jgi:hypothetical protein